MQKPVSKTLINTIAIGLTAALVLFCVYGWAVGWFRDTDSMRAFVARAGVMGPVVFVIIQILQVVLPFIPGGVTLMTGVLAFGPWWGFAFNYLGVVLGSLINFFLAKRYGRPLVTHLVDEDTYNKYVGKIEGKGYERFFAIAILLPLFPDDTLCLLSGLTKMSYSKFMAIILLLKPPSIAAYSFAFIYGGRLMSFLMSLIS